MVLHLWYTFFVMPTTHARINTVLEPPLYKAVEQLAHAEGISLSQKVRDLVKEALELVEDAGLDAIVSDRRKRSDKLLSRDEVVRRLKSK